MSTKTKKKPEIETHAFQAETKKLLDLMIHSLYTKKEIFLRELVSNASDALDRLRFEGLTQPGLYPSDEKLEIRLDSDTQARTLTLSDNGIGMSREEVIANIGTIAHSGSRELMDKLRQSPTGEEVTDLIGQFGVGFYSAFMAAERVTLVTRRAGEEEASRWESRGDGQFSLGEAQRSGHGTTITLHLKPVDHDAGIEDFTDKWILQRIVKRYSDFVAYPIIYKDQREEVEKGEDGKPIEGGKKTLIYEDKVFNSMKPIWTRPESDVTKEEYREFYKHISRDWNEPMKTLRFKAEGRVEYQALVFIPSQAPPDFYGPSAEYGLRLYVRRVLILDRYEDLVPRYMRFLKGIVDSSDLPLNISRQRLQEDRHIVQIRKWLTRKVLDTLAEMRKNEEEQYLEFWQHFGKSLKEGASGDYENKDKLLPLLLFQSSNDPEKLTSLAEYVERMKDDQEVIYHLVGESRAMVESSPHLEALLSKGYEVLYLVDRVDELLLQTLPEYDDKKLKSVGKGTVELGSKEEKEAAEKKRKEQEEEHKDLLETLQQRLDTYVKQVRFSTRLTTSPACMVGAEHDYSPQLEKYLLKGKGGGDKQRRILELNPEHQIVGKLEEQFQADKEAPVLDDYAQLLFGYALLAEGTELEEPVRFNKAMAELMVRTL